MARITRDDLAEMRRCNNRPCTNPQVKNKEQSDIERQKNEFLAKGGKIREIPIGASGEQVRITERQKSVKVTA